MSTEQSTSFLAGGGEMGALIRSMDWSDNPLGSPESWPQSLKTTVSLCLSSTFPILIAWGPETIQIYNDSYRPICGDLHPASMGQNFRICWESALPVVGDKFTRGQQGEGTYIKDQRMFLDRNGYLEEAFMTFSFGPIRDEQGEVGGIFHPITETTDKMLSSRRTQCLRDLMELTGKAKTVEEIYSATEASAEALVLDVPFVLIYKLDNNRENATLVSVTGVVADSPLVAAINAGEGAADTWQFNEAALTKETVVVNNLQSRFGQFSCGPYDNPPHTALTMPVYISGQEQPWGYIIAGVSVCRALDQEYLNFYELFRNAYNTALSNVYAYEQELQRAEALAAIDRSKTAFFSNVSHEFRTPLTLMMGPLEELLQQPALQQPVYRDNLDSTFRNAQRLLKLVNNLLDFSRAEADRLKLQFQPVDLALLTTDLAGSFRSIIEKAGMALQVNCALAGKVYVDKSVWEKIVLNLLSNAFKFTLEGSITVNLYQQGQQAVLEVSDTGVGIPKDELPKMFERFHRVENSVGRTHEGSGIGLSLVSELVKLHAGTIGVTSAEGEGSTFTISIPLGKAHLDALLINESESEASSSFLKGAFLQEASSLLEGAPALVGGGADVPIHSRQSSILVVDDNADMRNYLSRILSPAYVVVTAKNGEDALHQLQTFKPQLVISDIMMPVMDGKVFLQNLRQNAETAAIPLIFLSARAGNEARVDGLEAGADDYLVKPFSAAELQAKVNTHVRLARERLFAQEQAEMLEKHVRQRTAELYTANELLTKANQELEEFFFISSHDLQEPLRKIQTFGNFSIDMLEEGSKSHQYVSKMITSASRMSALVKDLLSYSKLTAADTRVQVDLDFILAQVIDDFEATIIERGVIINAGYLPKINAMPFQVTQLFSNLVGNAIKFSEGVPIININSRPLPAIERDKIDGLDNQFAYLEITVADKGIGFEQEYAQQAFNVFRRLVPQESYPGTGMGLTICRRVMQNHKGLISATSAPGQGTTFYLYFPA